MNYVWEAGKRGRVMHIQRFSPAGEPTGTIGDNYHDMMQKGRHRPHNRERIS